MNSNQRRRAGKPLTYEGTRAKYLSWIKNCGGKINFIDWLSSLKPREVAGFVLHGDKVIDSVGYNTILHNLLKKDLKDYVNSLAEKVMLSDEINS